MHGSRDLEALASNLRYRDPEAVAHFVAKEKKEMTEIVREIEVPGPSFQSERVREKRAMDAPIEQWIFAASDVGTKVWRS